MLWGYVPEMNEIDNKQADNKELVDKAEKESEEQGL